MDFNRELKTRAVKSGLSWADCPGRRLFRISGQSGLQVTVMKRFGFPVACNQAIASWNLAFISLGPPMKDVGRTIRRPGKKINCVKGAHNQQNSFFLLIE